ncbi:MAG: hypothetical protein AAFR47_23170 [Pseudomonadota bacterium]
MILCLSLTAQSATSLRYRGRLDGRRKTSFTSPSKGNAAGIREGGLARIWRMCFALILLATPAYPIDEEVEPVTDQAEYAQCHDVLWSAPANTLSTYVNEGYGARLESGDLEEVVRSLRCSDAQIVAYMEHHGLPYLGTSERADILETGDGQYNRVIHFCIPNRGWLTRALRGDCGGATSFWMVDDRIQYISSHGFK